MDKPTSLNNLIIYLKGNPKIRRENGCLWSFLYYKSGGLWFSDESHMAWYIPVSCGMTNAETGLIFHDDRFEVTKFSITRSYFYNKKQK